jgi:hypothetical protein
MEQANTASPRPQPPPPEPKRRSQKRPMCSCYIRMAKKPQWDEKGGALNGEVREAMPARWSGGDVGGAGRAGAV